MSVADDRRKRFVDTFNAAIGSKVGRPMTYLSDAQINSLVAPEFKQKAALLLAKKIKATKPKAVKQLPTSTTAAQLAAMLNGGTINPKDTKIELKDLPTVKKSSGGFSLSGLLKSVKHAAGSLTDLVGISDPEHPQGTLASAASSVNTSKPTQTVMGGINRVVDIAQRPAYAINEASKRFGEDPSLGALATGAGAGITGKSKTGFGQVIESAVPNQNIYLKKIEGLAGDVLLDPVTYFSGGSKIVAKGAIEEGLAKAAREGTLEVGSDALKSEAKRITKKAIEEAGIPNVKKLRTGSTINKTLDEHIADQVAEKIDNTFYDLRRGNMIGGVESHGTLANSVGEGVRESLIDNIRRPRDKYISQLRLGKKFTDTERNALKASNPEFGKWLDIADDITKKNTTLSRDEIAKQTDILFNEAMQPQIDAIKAVVHDNLNDALLRVPTVKWMGKELHLPTLGKIGKVGKEAALKSNNIENLNKALRYSSWFPGYSTHIAQKLKSMNVQAYDAFKNDLENFLAGTTRAQRINIHRAIQEGTTLTGEDGLLQAGIKERYKKMYDDEIGAGARSKTATPPADNYVYNQISKSDKRRSSFDDNWRKPKKEQVELHGNLGKYTSMGATRQGMRVEEDAGQALLARQAKHIRELTRINFKKDLVEHYGIRSQISPRLAEQAGMHIVDPKQFEGLYKKLRIKDGERLFLDKDIEKIYENYNKMVSYASTPAANAAVAGIDNVTKLFKTANTIYWPGFHLRNAVSDIFMGMFDGVKNHRYAQIMNALTHKDTAKLLVGGEKVPFRTIYKSYIDNAASAGFFDSEMKYGFDPSDLSTTRYMDSIRKPFRKVNTTARNLSQGREDFGRLVHYYHALDDEMTHQLSKGLGWDKAWKNAEEAALERVNKFKFDYNALTPNEQSIRRFGMPFYTYMRKATPVLIEQLFMHPKYFAYINKLQRSLAPSDEFVGAGLPGWMVDNAYSELASSPNHIGFTDALFPTRTLQETFSNPVSRMNPILQGMYEYQSGKDTFSGKPVGKGIGGVGDILKNKWRGISTYRSLESDTKPTLDKWAGLFGIPLVEVSAARQGQRLAELEHELTNRSTSLNKALDDHGLKVKITGDKIYLIRPKSPTPDEIKHNKKPRYPPNDKEEVLGVYNTFNELPFKV